MISPALSLVTFTVSTQLLSPPAPRTFDERLASALEQLDPAVREVWDNPVLDHGPRLEDARRRAAQLGARIPSAPLPEEVSPIVRIMLELAEPELDQPFGQLIMGVLLEEGLARKSGAAAWFQERAPLLPEVVVPSRVLAENGFDTVTPAGANGEERKFVARGDWSRSVRILVFPTRSELRSALVWQLSTSATSDESFDGSSDPHPVHPPIAGEVYIQGSDFVAFGRANVFVRVQSPGSEGRVGVALALDEAIRSQASSSGLASLDVEPTVTLDGEVVMESRPRKSARSRSRESRSRATGFQP